MPIYLNRNLVLDLYSMFIDGYLESKSIRFVNDKNNTLRAQNGQKDQNSRGVKTTDVVKNTDKENYKEKNVCIDEFNSLTKDFNNFMEHRLGARDELTIKKIYTSFYYFNDLKKNMIKRNLIRTINGEDILNGNIHCGEYVEFQGMITTESIIYSVMNLIDIIEAYDSKELDKLLKDSELKDSLTTYTIILKQLKNFIGEVNRNNTNSMIMSCNGCKVVMSVNLNYFWDKNAYMYDNALDDCRVLCKITKCAKKDEKINMLSKTCMEGYYEKFLTSIKPYFDLLNEKNIIVPTNFLQCMNIDGPCIEVIPVAMYV